MKTEPKVKKKQPRTDKRRNVGKVAEVLAKNPQATVREIAQDIGLSKSATHRATQEVGQSGTKDETIAYIVGSSKNRIKKAQEIFDRYITEVEEKEKLERSDVTLVKDIVKDDLARVTVFWWDVTDDNWGLNAEALAKMSVDELLSIIKNK